jgi:TPR repeat protein
MKKITGARAAAMAVLTLSGLYFMGSTGATGAELDLSTYLAAVPAETERPNLSNSRDEFAAWLPRALAGDREAAYRLAQVYARDADRWEDLTQAAHWFRKAAEAGHAPAQLGLATLYGKGLGVSQDYVRSYAWFAVAAETRDYGLARDQALELRDMMAAFLTPEQRAEAERLAAEWEPQRER